MALSPRGNGSGWFLSVSLTDNQDDVSVLRFSLTSADYASAVTDSAAVIAALDGVTRSTISSTSLSFVQDEDAFAYGAGSDNGVRARLTFQLAGSVEKATLDIPAPEEGIFQAPSGPGNGIVDTLDPAVVAYAQIYQAGNECFISDGELSDFLLRGKRTTR